MFVLILGIFVTLSPRPAHGQPADSTRTYLVGQAGVGRGGDPFAAVQVEFAFGRIVRWAPELMFGDGGAIGSLSLLFGLPRDLRQATRVYGGIGLGFLVAGPVWLGRTGVARLGVEWPIRSDRFAARLELRVLRFAGETGYGLMGGIRVP